MDTVIPGELAARKTDLEAIWQSLDTVMDSLSENDWQRAHGADWVMADVPYHLAYFDRDLIAQGIVQGRDVPQSAMNPMRSRNAMDRWNHAKFAERPSGQTVAQSLAQMRESRDAIRQAIAALTDADLNRPFWMPLLQGWQTLRLALQAAIAHSWGELMQMVIRLARPLPAIPPTAIHQSLAFYMDLLGLFVDPQEAARTPMTIVMAFTGSGGGAWTFAVAGGTVRVTEEQATQPDLVMTQSPETFVKTFNTIISPIMALETGELQVQGMQNLPAFGALFPPPEGDTQLPMHLELPAS